MGFRFRKSIKIGKHSKINLSKSGASFSTGIPGARLNISKKGVRKTLSIPGTGISYSDYSSYKKSNKKPKKEEIISLPRLETKSIFRKIFSSDDDLNSSNEEYNKAIDFIEKDDLVSAKEHLIKSLSFNSKNYYANLFLASIYFNEYNFKEAIDYILKIYEKDNIETLNILVNSYFALEEFESVIEILEEKDELSDDYKFILGMSYYNLKRFKKASEVFKSGPVLKRTYTEDVLNFKYYLGMSYLEIDDIEKAKRQFNKIYENNSDFKDIRKIAKDMNFAVGEDIRR